MGNGIPELEIYNQKIHFKMECSRMQEEE